LSSDAVLSFHIEPLHFWNLELFSRFEALTNIRPFILPADFMQCHQGEDLQVIAQ